MRRIARKNIEIIEPIERLDAKYVEANGDTARVWASLDHDEIAFICCEAAKCLASPRYFLEDYFFIRIKEQALLRPLWPFLDSQEMFLEAAERQLRNKQVIRLIVLKARQLGITSISVGLMCWLAFLHPMFQVLSMADEDERVYVNFEMARTAYDNLPWWLRPEKRYDEKGTILGFDRAKEAERKADPGMGSLIHFESSNQPSGAAYSKSLYGAHLAEVARYRNSDAITEGIFGSLVKYRNSIGIMESTARGRTGKGAIWHNICNAAQDRELPDLAWEFLFIEWFREPGYCVSVPENFQASNEELALRKKVKEECDFDLSNGQLQWSRQQRAQFEAVDGTPEKFDQEFPATPTMAFIASGQCAFSKKRLGEMIIHFCRKPEWTGKIRLFKDNVTPKLVTLTGPEAELWIWEFPKKNGTYYIGADPTLGTGDDPACAQVYCIPDDITYPLRQVARWRGFSAPIQFARILAALGYFYNTAEVAPECNKITTVASDLVKVLGYPRWYRWLREDKARNAYSNWIGWQTTWRNKTELISRYREALDEWTVLVKCEKDVEEMLDFVEKEDGTDKYEGREHDDCVMAHMISYYCATQLRPRSGGNPTGEPIPAKDKDFQNSEYSPIYDREDMIYDPSNPESVPDFYML